MAAVTARKHGNLLQGQGMIADVLDDGTVETARKFFREQAAAHLRKLSTPLRLGWVLRLGQRARPLAGGLKRSHQLVPTYHVAQRGKGPYILDEPRLVSFEDIKRSPRRAPKSRKGRNTVLIIENKPRRDLKSVEWCIEWARKA